MFSICRLKNQFNKTFVNQEAIIVVTKKDRLLSILAQYRHNFYIGVILKQIHTTKTKLTFLKHVAIFYLNYIE